MPIKTEIVYPKEDRIEKKEAPQNFIGDLLGDFVGNLKMDDLILIGLVLVLLFEGGDDWIIIALIAYMLFF
jgi:hypothetical protein